jgi:hypothetical protein
MAVGAALVALGAAVAFVLLRDEDLSADEEAAPRCCPIDGPVPASHAGSRAGP